MDSFAYETGYDSDYIDEETEHLLYNAVHCGDTPALNNDHSQKDETTPDSPRVTFSIGEPEYISTLPENDYHKSAVESIIITPSSTRKQLENPQLSISSFIDVSSEEEEEFHVVNRPRSVSSNSSGTENGSDTDYSVDLDYLRAHETPKVHTTTSSPGWNHNNLVMGVAAHSAASICSLDESALILDRLSSSRSDPNLWRIVNADRTPLSSTGKSRNSRYFTDEYNSICSKCRKRGHFTFQCRNSGPSCILCGMEGHMEDVCPRVYCYACLAPGHGKHQCAMLNQMRDSVCQRCHVKGHQSNLCPELWRQYKNTTRAGKPIPPPRNQKPPHPRGCCNCGGRGHTIDECKRKPSRTNMLGATPKRRVLVYDKHNIYGGGKVATKGKRSLVRLGGKLSRRKEMAARAESSVSVDQPVQSTSWDNVETPLHRSAKRKTNKRLLEQIMQKEYNISEIKMENEEPPKIEASEPLSNLDRLKSRPSTSSMEEAQFLTLYPNGRGQRGNSNSRTPTPWKSRRRPSGRDSGNTSSPFMWINQRTAEVGLNDRSDSNRPTWDGGAMSSNPPPLFDRGARQNRNSESDFGENRKRKSFAATSSATPSKKMKKKKRRKAQNLQNASAASTHHQPSDQPEHVKHDPEIALQKSEQKKNTIPIVAATNYKTEPMEATSSSRQVDGMTIKQEPVQTDVLQVLQKPTSIDRWENTNSTAGPSQGNRKHRAPWPPKKNKNKQNNPKKKISAMKKSLDELNYFLSR